MGCGASVNTSTVDQNGRHNTKVPLPVTRKSMKGDYSQFQLAKYHREKLQKERQLKLYIAADELSGKVLEDRERLSLGTRSRATSRNTSRTTSPTNNKRTVQLNESTIPMTPVIEDRNRSESYRSDVSLNNSSKGAKNHTGTQSSKKKTKTKHKKKTSKGEKTKSKSKKKKSKKSKSKRQISLESDDRDSGLEDSALNIHHSEQSDDDHSADDETENVFDEANNDGVETNTTYGDNSELKEDKNGDDYIEGFNTNSPTRDDSTDNTGTKVGDGQTDSENVEGFIDSKENIGNADVIDRDDFENRIDTDNVLQPVTTDTINTDDSFNETTVIYSADNSDNINTNGVSNNSDKLNEFSNEQESQEPIINGYDSSEHVNFETVEPDGDTCVYNKDIDATSLGSSRDRSSNDSQIDNGDDIA